MKKLSTGFEYTVIGSITFIASILCWFAAMSAIHEILSGVGLLITVVCFGIAGIFRRLNIIIEGKPVDIAEKEKRLAAVGNGIRCKSCGFSSTDSAFKEFGKKGELVCPSCNAKQ